MRTQILSSLVLQHFNEISEAPDAVPRLRRFILDLAVRGKLVEQAPGDEPAGALLKRIEAERHKFFKAGAGKRTKPQPPISDEEIPIPYAQNVVFARLSAVARIEKGTIGIQKANPGRFPLVSLAEARASCDEYQFDTKAAIIPLISSTGHGHASIKRLHYQEGQFALANILCAVIPFAPQIVSARFLYEYFYAYKEQLLVSKMIGTANVSLTIGKIAEAPVPIISPAAQNRMYELMALCDELETARTQRETRRDRLVASTLHGLNNGDAAPSSATRPSFKETARFYFNHLPQLTTRPEHIKQLRQTILNLAVRGKLVAQDPRDEPASVLLARIKEAKRQLLKGSVDRRIEPTAGPAPVVPLGWSAVRFEQLLLALQTGPFGSALHQSDYEAGGAPVVNPASIQAGRIIPIDKMAVGKTSLARLAAFKLREGDVVMARRGEMGRCAVITEREAGWLCGTGSLILRFTEDILPSFIVAMMSAPQTRNYLAGSSVGSTMQNLNQAILRKMVTGLPPLSEQQRIVAKVNALMSLCDKFEAQLKRAAANRRSVFESILREALCGYQTTPFVRGMNQIDSDSMMDLQVPAHE